MRVFHIWYDSSITAYLDQISRCEHGLSHPTLWDKKFWIPSLLRLKRFLKNPQLGKMANTFKTEISRNIYPPKLETHSSCPSSSFLLFHKLKAFHSLQQKSKTNFIGQKYFLVICKLQQLQTWKHVCHYIHLNKELHFSDHHSALQLTAISYISYTFMNIVNKKHIVTF